MKRKASKVLALVLCAVCVLGLLPEMAPHSHAMEAWECSQVSYHGIGAYNGAQSNTTVVCPECGTVLYKATSSGSSGSSSGSSSSGNSGSSSGSNGSSSGSSGSSSGSSGSSSGSSGSSSGSSGSSSSGSTGTAVPHTSYHNTAGCRTHYWCSWGCDSCEYDVYNHTYNQATGLCSNCGASNGHTHSYKETISSTHPHPVTMSCSCGYSYSNGNKVVNTCAACVCTSGHNFVARSYSAVGDGTHRTTRICSRCSETHIAIEGCSFSGGRCTLCGGAQPCTHSSYVAVDYTNTTGGWTHYVYMVCASCGGAGYTTTGTCNVTNKTVIKNNNWTHYSKSQCSMCGVWHTDTANPCQLITTKLVGNANYTHTQWTKCTVCNAEYQGTDDCILTDTTRSYNGNGTHTTTSSCSFCSNSYKETYPCSFSNVTYADNGDGTHTKTETCIHCYGTRTVTESCTSASGGSTCDRCGGTIPESGSEEVSSTSVGATLQSYNPDKEETFVDQTINESAVLSFYRDEAGEIAASLTIYGQIETSDTEMDYIKAFTLIDKTLGKPVYSDSGLKQFSAYYKQLTSEDDIVSYDVTLETTNGAYRNITVDMKEQNDANTGTRYRTIAMDVTKIGTYAVSGIRAELIGASTFSNSAKELLYSTLSSLNPTLATSGSTVEVYGDLVIEVYNANTGKVLGTYNVDDDEEALLEDFSWGAATLRDFRSMQDITLSWQTPAALDVTAHYILRLEDGSSTEFATRTDNTVIQPWETVRVTFTSSQASPPSNYTTTYYGVDSGSGIVEGSMSASDIFSISNRTADWYFYWDESDTKAEDGSIEIIVRDSSTGADITAKSTVALSGVGSGTYHDNLEFGTYTATASCDGYDDGSASVTITEDDPDKVVTIYLDPSKPDSGSITVIVRDAANGYADITSRATVAINGTSGSYRDGLSFGTYTATASLSGYSSGSGSATITENNPDETIVIDLTKSVEKTGSITVIVRDASNGYADITSRATVAISGTSGSYRSGLALGKTYTATASLSGYTSGSGSATITEASPNGVITIDLSKPTPTSGTLKVVVLDASNDADITSTATISVSSLGSGSYFSNAPYGTYTATASASGYVTGSGSGTVSASNPNGTIVIRLSKSTTTVTKGSVRVVVVDATTNAVITDIATITLNGTQGGPTFSNLSFGTYTGVAMATGYTTGSASTVISATNPDAVLRIPLTPSGGGGSTTPPIEVDLEAISITPSTYYENREVLSVVTIGGSGQDFIPGDNVTVRLRSSDSSIVITNPTVTGIVLADGTEMIVAFRWTAPEVSGSKTFTLTATVDPDNIIDEIDETNNTVSTTVTIHNENIPTLVENEKVYPTVPTRTSNPYVEWEEQRYEGGRIVTKTFWGRLTIDAELNYRTKALGYLRSGYGFEIKVTTTVTTNYDKAELFTGAQRAYGYVPHFGYDKAISLVTTGDRTAYTCVYTFAPNPAQSVYSNPKQFIPIWWKDAYAYVVQAAADSVYTPGGQLWAYVSGGSKLTITVSGSMYDDDVVVIE